MLNFFFKTYTHERHAMNKLYWKNKLKSYKVFIIRNLGKLQNN